MEEIKKPISALSDEDTAAMINYMATEGPRATHAARMMNSLSEQVQRREKEDVEV